MSLTLPGELVWVLDLLGYSWPEADEEALHQVAEAWRAFGKELEEIQAQGEGFARTVVSSSFGTAIEGFSKDWGAYTGANGEDRYIPDARTACDVIALAFDVAAVAVLTAKLAVIVQLIALAMEIIAAQAAAPFTFGLSEVGALGATQATRLIVRELLDRLKKEVMEAITKAMEHATMDALKKVAKKVVKEQVKQFVQERVVDAAKDKAREAAVGMAQNLGQQGIEAYFDARSGIDLGETADVAKTAVGDYVDGLKNEVTGGEGSALAGYADPATYVDHAKETVSGAVGDRAQHGVDALARHGAGAGDADTTSVSDGAAASTVAISTAAAGSASTGASGSTGTSAATGTSGSPNPSGHADDWARNEFG
ncbi:PE-PGRS family protein [Streptomyces sp. NBC_01017]|uniref:WXG100-like domain-containing protein n=1 Tax=Streptomyces sp. NBC_01017 TaxID=2903721 RepID=UPI00386CB8F8|nr:PE-PGRS family protein [Streptomyces sp. NBC_01017]